jgi:hypothetical protein
MVPLLLVSVLAVAGCGSTHSSAPASGGGSTVHFAKTKFVIHAGLAFGVFHRWIYKPFKRGDFNHPLSHKLTLAKALVAAGVVIHEVRLASADAGHSRLLSNVVLPLAGIVGTVHLISSALGHHHAPDASAVSTANSQISGAESASKAAGQPIQETTAGSHI